MVRKISLLISRRLYGGIAQLVEHMLCKHGVVGSNPITSTMASQDWIYYGVFLEERSKENLLMFVKHFVKIPKNWRIYCDHMTIVFNDLSERAYLWGQNLEPFIGQKVRLRVTHIGVSEKSVAVMVTGYSSANEFPHVTVAIAPCAKPVDSNKIQKWTEIDDGLSMVGTIDFVERRKK